MVNFNYIKNLFLKDCVTILLTPFYFYKPVYAEPELAFFTGIGAEQAAPAPPKVDFFLNCFDLQYLTRF